MASQKKVVSFWEAQNSSSKGNVKTSSTLINTYSKSMSSLIQDEPEVEEKRGFIPSDVAKDPMKKEFLINLSKKIFSPNDQQSKRRKSSRVRRNRSNNPIIQFLYYPPDIYSPLTHFSREFRLGHLLCLLPAQVLFFPL